MTSTAARCSCCGLLQPWVGGKGLCSVCSYHQSNEINQTVKRHQEHEVMLRERLTAASEWAANADAERKEFGQKMHWALKSRDWSIRVLRQINDMHELRSNGSCKCKKPKACKIAELLDDRGLQELIRRVDEHEAKQRERERAYRELMATGDPYELKEWLQQEGEDGVLRRRHGADTA